MMRGLLLLALVALPVEVFAAQPSDARRLYEQARELEASGNAQGALARLWEAAGLAPDDPEIQNALGEALARIGALDGAVNAFERSLAARPTSDRAANNLVLTMVQAGRGPEAVTWADARVREKPDDAARLFTLGLAQSEPDVNAAIGTFRRVLDREPRHILARYNLALALKRADRPREALEELERIVAVERRPEALYQIGIIRWQAGDLPAAAAALEAAVSGDPQRVDAYEALGAVRQQGGEYKAAAAALRKAISLAPALPAPHVSLARTLQLEGRIKESEKEFAVAAELRRREAADREALTLTSAGIAAAARGDRELAVTQFTRAIGASSSYAPAHYQLGLVLVQLGRPTEARQAFARARQLNSSLIPPDPFR